MSAETKFETLKQAFNGDPGVSAAKMFGAPGLRIGSKFFVCLVKDELVAKLPNERIETLIAAKHGHPFEPMAGRTMKGWISVAAGSPADWLTLAQEARRFVAASSQQQPRALAG